MQAIFAALHEAGGSSMGIIRYTQAAVVATCVIVAAAEARAGGGDRDVWVNGLRMSADQILLLEQAFGFCVQDGAYRYDPESGDFRAIGMSGLAERERPPQYAHAGDRADDENAAYK
jgi:hypothetical protein